MSSVKEVQADTEEDSRTDEDEEEVVLDRSPGSGARSWADHVEWESRENGPGSNHYLNDGRSDTNTTFYHWECPDPGRNRHQLHRDPSDRRSWKKLSDWNDGVGDPNRSQQNNAADKRRMAQAICNSLDLTSYQTERTVHVVDNTNLSKFQNSKSTQMRLEEFCLATISLVVDHDVQDAVRPEDFELEDWILYRDDFRQIMDEHDVVMDDIWVGRRTLVNETEHFEADQHF